METKGVELEKEMETLSCEPTKQFVWYFRPVADGHQWILVCEELDYFSQWAFLTAEYVANMAPFFFLDSNYTLVYESTFEIQLPWCFDWMI